MPSVGFLSTNQSTIIGAINRWGSYCVNMVTPTRKFNSAQSSRARLAGTAPRNRCPPMPASISTSAKAVARCCVPCRATAPCFVGLGISYTGAARTGVLCVGDARGCGHHAVGMRGAGFSRSSPSPAQAPQFGPDPSPTTAAELVPALDRSIANAKQVIGRMDDAKLMEIWQLKSGDREVLAIPRIAFLRSVMLNHWYHHRGQLTMYLRELGVAVPSIYGPSADENPFR